MSNQLMRPDVLNDLARFAPFGSVDDFFRDFGFKNSLREIDRAIPIRMDISETENAYKITAEMPGLKKEDIQIKVESNHVSISAEIRRETEKKDGATLLRSERYVGQQFRSFSLDHEIDDAKAEAKYQDGILELTLPKRLNGNSTKKLVVN